MVNFRLSKLTDDGHRVMPQFRVFALPLKEYEIVKDTNTRKKTIVVGFTQAQIDSTKADIAKMVREREKQDYVAPVSANNELLGHLAEQAFSSWLFFNSSIPFSCWQAETEKLADDNDFWLVKDDKTVLTIDPKSTYMYSLSRAELQINLKQFNNHKNDIYLLVQVLLKERIARILGYATRAEVSSAKVKGAVTREINGKKCPPFIHLKPTHSVDDLVSLFKKKLGINVELDGAQRTMTDINEYIASLAAKPAKAKQN